MTGSHTPPRSGAALQARVHALLPPTEPEPGRYTTENSLAAQLGVSPRDVQRAVEALEEHGLVERHERGWRRTSGGGTETREADPGATTDTIDHALCLTPADVREAGMREAAIRIQQSAARTAMDLERALRLAAARAWVRVLAWRWMLVEVGGDAPRALGHAEVTEELLDGVPGEVRPGAVAAGELGGEGEMSGWIPTPADGWAETAELLTSTGRPWPESAAITDLRWGCDEHGEPLPARTPA